MSFDPINAPVDYVLLAGQRSPGLADVVGAGSPRKFDERRGYGLSGATTVFRGISLARFAVQLRLYTTQDWEDWHAFRPLVLRELPDDTDRQRAEARLAGAQNELAVLEEIGDSGQRIAAQRRVDAAQRQVLRAAAGPRPRALDIWHPILEDLGIGSVVVEDVLQPLQTADGEWTVEIKFLEHRRPRPALARARGAQQRPQPTDEVELYIQRLSAQRDALAQELES